MADNHTNIILTAVDKTQAAIKSATGGIQTLSQTISSVPGFGGIAASLGALAGAGTFKLLIADTISWAAGMDDLAEKTGASVENLSSLSRIAKISGADMGMVEQGLIRMSKALSGADDEAKGAGHALAFLGLKAEDLRKMDSAEALKAVADAMAKYGDGTGKTALALDLWGKSGAQLLPLIKDLADQQLKGGKLTTEQAAAAEQLEKAWNKVNAEGGAWSKQMAVDMIPTLASLLDFVVQSKDTLYAMSAGLVVTGNAMVTFAQVVAAAIGGGFTDEGQAYIKQKLAENSRFIDAAREDLDKRASAYKSLREKIDATLAGGDAIKPKADYKGKGAGAGKASSGKTASASAADKSESWDDMINRKVAEELQKPKIAAMELQAMIEALDRQFFDGTITLEDYDRAMAKISKTSATAGKDAKELDKIGQELGMTFSSAFEDAILGGKNFGDVLKGLEQDIARIILRKSITEPIGTGISDAIKGSGIGASIGGWFKDVFKFEDGGIMGAGGPLPLRAYAGGGIANSPQLALYGEGSMNEAFVPLPDGRRIPVAMQGGSAPAVTINQTINIDSRSDQATIVAAMMHAKEAAKSEIMQSMRRGGAFA